MAWAEQGYAVRPLFAREELEPLEHLISGHMDRVADAMLKPREDTAPDATFDERIERIAASDQSFAHLLGTAVATDAFRAPEIARLAHDPRLTGLAAETAGCEIGERLFRLRLNSSALPRKRHGWHSDVARHDGSACSTLRVTAWIPLSDAGPDSGGLELVPGTRDRPVPHVERDGGIRIDEDALAGLETAMPTVRAGECLLIDRFTPHRALANLSGRTRWSLVVWMKSAQAASGC